VSVVADLHRGVVGFMRKCAEKGVSIIWGAMAAIEVTVASLGVGEGNGFV